MKNTWLATAAVLVLALSSAYAADVKLNWAGKCAGCHGKEGKGDTKIGLKMGAKDFSDPKVQAAIKDEAIFKAIKEGLKKDGKVIMTPFADKLTDEEIKALAAHVRSLKKP